jgi:hypothetical protein
MNKDILQDIVKYNANPSELMFNHIKNEALTLTDELLGLVEDTEVISGIQKFSLSMLRESLAIMQVHGKIQDLITGYDLGHGVEELTDNPSLSNYTHLLIILIYSILKEKENENT